MAKMHAAVVSFFDEPPHYQEFDVPTPGEDQELVDVLAVGLHPRVRSGAAGKHYITTGQHNHRTAPSDSGRRRCRADG